MIKAIEKAVEKNRELMKNAEEFLWNNPETGYKEWKSSKYLEEQFEKLGYTLIKAGNIPGFYTVVDTGKKGPEILVLAELDGVICPTHPCADKQTGAVHACGHHAQCATILGVAAALKEESVLKNLCGRIRLCLVPAEEGLEIEERNQKIREGIISYIGGKSEFLSRGYFDGVDLAFMSHQSTGDSRARTRAVGNIMKTIIFKGKASHAGGAPWAGKNALYAATTSLNAVNALRETFQEKDYIRWHPIITNGGEMVNAIPETVKIESYLRGASFEAMERENKKINRAICGSAAAFGVQVEIDDSFGYSPLSSDRALLGIAKDCYETLLEDATFEIVDGVGTGSTDMGDLSCVMPVMHPYIGGAKGMPHGNDFYIEDFDKACVLNAKWYLLILEKLTANGGEKAFEIKKNYQPLFKNKEEYFAYKNAMKQKGDKVEYLENGEIKIHE